VRRENHLCGLALGDLDFGRVHPSREGRRASAHQVPRPAAHARDARTRRRHPPEGRVRRLGHASITITLDTYSHAIPAMQETAAELVASLVFDPVEPVAD
jgi:integrase